MKPRGVPKVVIDARMIGPIPHGFSRYVSRLAEGLSKVSPSDYEPVFLVRQPMSSFLGFSAIASRARFLSPLELTEVPRVLKAEGAALYHSPSFSSLLYSPCPWISTVHDLNHLIYGGLKEKAYYRLVLKRFAKKAVRLLTVSEFSRQEIAKWLERPAASIEVVKNALSADYCTPIDAGTARNRLAELGLAPKSYFLCLSNLKPHKNTEVLVEAYRQYRSSNGEWPLVLNLKGSFGVPGVKEFGAIGDQDARILVQEAGAVICPSSYEGFGLPAVEAVALGAPLIASKIPPHEESLQGIAEVKWVVPTDILGWTQALTQASRGEISGPSALGRTRLLENYGVMRLGVDMDRIYRAVLNLSS